MSNAIPKHKTVLADLGLFYAAAIWGSTFFIVKELLNDIDPITLVAYRFLLAGVTMLPFLLWKKLPLLRGFKEALFLALILWALYVPQTIGLQYTTASNSAFITGLFVIFVPIFMRTIFKRKPTMNEMIAVFVALAGLYVLTGGLKDINLGDMITLIAAMTYALHVLYTDKFMKLDFNPYVIAFWQFILVGFFSLVTALLLDLPMDVGSSSAIKMILFLTLFPTLSAFVIQLVAQKITAPLKVSLIFTLEPVFGGLFAWTLGGEVFEWHRAAGGALIFVALIISSIPGRPRKRVDYV